MNLLVERKYLVFLMGILALPKTSVVGYSRPEYRYYTDTERAAYLTDVSESFPDITYLYSIGKSVEGRELWVMAIGEKPRSHVPLRPDVKYEGNMHGNEIGNQVHLLHLIHHLVTEYSTNSTIASFLRTTRVHILPTVNPDGAEKAISLNVIRDRKTWSGSPNASLMHYVCNGVYGRTNKYGFDLNRNFPDVVTGNGNTPRQPETQAVMEWMNAYQFVLSANMHGGALVANYPLDRYDEGGDARYSRSQDDDLFRYMAKVYSYSHHTMHRGVGCKYDGQYIYNFTDGITNGAQWYPITGGLQDYNYFFAGCFEITLELHCCKFPPVTVLEEQWMENKDALIHYLMLAHMGVKGIVRSDIGLELKDVLVRVVGRERFEVRTTPFGEFWRLLLPGTYTLEIRKPGYKTLKKEVTVRTGPPLVLSLTLQKANGKGSRSTDGNDSISKEVVSITEVSISKEVVSTTEVNIIKEPSPCAVISSGTYNAIGSFSIVSLLLLQKLLTVYLKTI